MRRYSRYQAALDFLDKAIEEADSDINEDQDEDEWPGPWNEDALRGEDR